MVAETNPVVSTSNSLNPGGLMRPKLVLAGCLLFSFTSAVHAAPPPTEVQPVKEVLHGVEVVDPYRWLEGSAGLEPGKTDTTLDAKVSAWTDAQNAYTRSVLDRLPRRQEIEARLRKLEGAGFRFG